MKEAEYRELFEDLGTDALIDAAVNMAMDNDRLRDELDKATGVIR